MDAEKLKKFIFDASRATYASGDESIKEKQADGSKTIKYENGPYRFHDNYFGGEPYGGREVVFLNDKKKPAVSAGLSSYWSKECLVQVFPALSER